MLYFGARIQISENPSKAQFEAKIEADKNVKMATLARKFKVYEKSYIKMEEKFKIHNKIQKSNFC